MLRAHCRPLFLALFSLLCLSNAWAQYGASIQGVVTDQTGAAVAGAKVTAINQSTGLARETTSDASGFYRIGALPPGSYSISAEATSFRKQTTPDVVVAAEAVHGLNFFLQPGPAQETVTVSAGIQQLETENATVAGTITSEQVTNLPEFGRDPYKSCSSHAGRFCRLGAFGKWKLTGHSATSWPGWLK